jgi:hypothetical protein
MEMLEGMKSELDAYQENQSKYEPAAQNFLDGLRFFISMHHQIVALLIHLNQRGICKMFTGQECCTLCNNTVIF